VSISISDLVKKENFAMGPLNYSGGITHKLDDQTAMKVAEGIAAAASSWALPVVLICAYVRGESNFDPDASNPNLELAPDHKWPDAQSEAAHTDYGLCQINGNGSYLGVDAIKPSLDFLCSALIKNITWAVVEHDYPVEVGYEAYNKGRSGAEALFKQGGVHACNYGRIIASRVAEYQTLGVI